MLTPLDEKEHLFSPTFFEVAVGHGFLLLSWNEKQVVAMFDYSVSR